MFQADMILGKDKLIAKLASTPYFETWRTQRADGSEYVLRLFPTLPAFTAAIPNQQDISHLLNLAAIPGIAPLLGYEIAELGNKQVIVIRRRYYSKTLRELFLPDVANPPPQALLDAFAHLAVALDTLQRHLPKTVFDLAPGDLLLDGDVPVVSDYGLSVFEHYDAWNNRMPAFRRELDRGMGLPASYPALFESPIIRIDAQFALAALYVYFRCGFQMLEDPNDPVQMEAPIPVKLNLITKMMKIIEAAQQYEQKGYLPLLMLPNLNERDIVRRATVRDASHRYESGLAFVTALQRLFLQP